MQAVWCGVPTCARECSCLTCGSRAGAIYVPRGHCAPVWGSSCQPESGSCVLSCIDTTHTLFLGPGGVCRGCQGWGHASYDGGLLWLWAGERLQPLSWCRAIGQCVAGNGQCWHTPGCVCQAGWRGFEQTPIRAAQHSTPLLWRHVTDVGVSSLAQASAVGFA